MWGSLTTRISAPDERNGLTLFFATCCFVDLFGVFPVIALPRAIIECGWTGIPLAFLTFFIQIYTAIMLGRCWILSENMSTTISKKSRYPYAAMAELAFGKLAGWYVNILICVGVFCASVPNLLLAAQNLELIGLKVSNYQMDVPYCYWIIILGILMCPITWFGSPKDLKWLGCGSVVVVLTSSVLTWYCLLDAPGVQQPFIPDINWESIAIAYGILAFQFDVHPMVLTVQMDMKNKNQLGLAIFLAFLVTGALFLVTTAICYARFGAAIHYNALQGLPASSALYVDFVLATLQIGLSTVIGASPLFQGLEDFLNIPPGLGWRRCLLRTALVGLIVFMGEVVPRFDLVMSLFGALLMGQLMFVIPPLIYVKLRSMQTSISPALLAIPKTYLGYGATSQKDEKGTCSCMVKRHSHPLLASNPNLRACTLDCNYFQVINNCERFRSRLLRPDSSPLLGYHRRADRPDPPEGSDSEGSPRRTRAPERAHAPLSPRFPFLADFLSFESGLHAGPLKIHEKLNVVILVLLGLVAAGTSTFFAIRGSVNNTDSTPPCITNVTLAARFIYSQL